MKAPATSDVSALADVDLEVIVTPWERGEGPVAPAAPLPPVMERTKVKVRKPRSQSGSGSAKDEPWYELT